MSKSMIYAGTSESQSISEAGTSIQFPGIVRRYGCNCNISGGNVTVEGAGYYDGEVNVTISGTAAGSAVVQVYKDGISIPYANATVQTTSTSTGSVTVPFVIRQTCGCNESVISVICSGVACSVTNAGIKVEKM